MSEITEVKDVCVEVNNIAEDKSTKVDEEFQKIFIPLPFIRLPFIRLFENFVKQKQSKLVKLNLKLTPEIQKYFLLLCKENPDLFETFEETLKIIVLDDKINTKDIPNILLLVSKAYNVIKTNNGIPTVEPYELIRLLLHVSLAVYLESLNNSDNEILLDLMNIIDIAIKLIKIPPIISKKHGCLFRC